MKPNNIKELLSLFVLLALNAFFLYLVIFSTSFFTSITAIPQWKFLIAILISVFGISYLAHRKHHKKKNTFILALAFPFQFLLIILAAGIPFIILQIRIILYLGICFAIPLAFIFAYQYFTGTIVNDALKTYLTLTTAVILSAIFQKQIKSLFQIFSPDRLRAPKNLEPYKIAELSSYLLAENNMRFVVFLIYFILLVLINVFTLRGLGFYETAEIDNAVLQSFATFLAFDRIVATFKQLEFKPSEMIRKILSAVSNKMKDLDSNNS